MPKYEDLKFIRDKVMNFGNEAMIRKERGEPLLMDDLPPEVTPESNPALEDIDSLLDDITDDLKEGMGYSEVQQPEPEPEIDLDAINLDNFDEDKLTDSLADVSLDEALPDLDSLGNIENNQWDEIIDGSFEDLTNYNEPAAPSSQNDDVNIDDFNLDDINLDTPDDDGHSILDESDNNNNQEEISLGSDDLFDNSDYNLDNGSSDNDPMLDNMDLPNISLDDIGGDSINDDIGGDIESGIDLNDNDGTAETDALLAGLGGDNDVLSNDDFSSGDDLSSFNMDSISDDSSDQPSAAADDDLANFSLDNMNFDDTPAADNSADMPSENNDDDLSSFNLDSGLDSLDIGGADSTEPSSSGADSIDPLADFNLEDMANENNDSDLSSFNPDNDLGSFDMGGSADSDGLNADDFNSFGDFGLGGSDDDGGLSFGGTGDDDGGLSFGGDDEGGLSFGNDDDGGLSFDDMDNQSFDIGSSDDDNEDDISFGGGDESAEDILSSETPETAEQSADQTDGTDATNVVLSQDGSIKLSDAQRKQIIMSLSVMPKEAEIKIAQQIVSGSFSDEQLKPLIDALVNKEKAVNVLRIYEKVTGDTSLARVRSKKMSGHDFNEQKKSLSYQFKKNILPIISRLALIMIVLLSLILLYVKIIDPTFRASHYYKVGKQNIVENKFDNVEPYFEEAYKLQPRYGQVLDYARLYRTAKRYKAAEVKYDNAYHLKPSKPLAMEMADFYREMKDYGTAVRRYEDLKALDDKDEEVLIGLGRTHLDWASADRKHLETAKNIFQDVIDMNDKNKDAVFYMMDIAIREGNDKNVMKYYNYIDRNFEAKKVEDKYIDAYLDLADFMLETKRYDEMKDILEKTAKNPKTKLMPRQEYTFSKLKKALNVNDEERIHLKNVLKLFEYMKTAYPLEYNTKESLTLLSDTYNAMGENADKFSRGSIEAEQNYIKATQINPLNGKAYYNLGNYELNYKATKNALESAKNNLRNAEKLGYTNDRLNFNLGWIAYKQQDYKESFRRLKPLANKSEDNSNLKLFLGTVYYKMGNYDYAEAYLKENFDHFINLKQIHYPLDMEFNEDRQIAEMLVNCANNLGAVHHKKYQQTRKSRSRDLATKYYEDSMEYYDKLKESKEMFLYETTAAKTADAKESKLRQLQVTYAHQNLRNILYPAGNNYEPMIFEEFPLQYESSM